MTMPITKLMIVSGMVLVIAALASGPRLLSTSCHVDWCCSWLAGGASGKVDTQVVAAIAVAEARDFAADRFELSLQHRA